MDGRQTDHSFQHVPQEVATGSLPGFSQVDDLLREAHSRYASDDDGAVADYIPVLAEADPSLLGLAVVEAAGGSTTRAMRRIRSASSPSRNSSSPRW